MFQMIRLHLTLSEDDVLDLSKQVHNLGVEDAIVYEGVLPFQKLLACYKSMDALLFPSYIETFGLPLIEAAKVGIPIIASDLDYAREVLDGYKGATFVPSEDPIKWAASMKELCLNNKRFEAIHDEPSSWMEFYKVAYSLIE